MRAKLDALGNRIPAEDRPRIEAALAKKVPPVHGPTKSRLHRLPAPAVVRRSSWCATTSSSQKP
jgi:hypothetical protein